MSPSAVVASTSNLPAAAVSPATPWRRSQWLLWGVVPVLAAVLLAVALAPAQVQKSAFLHLNLSATALPDAFWSFATLFGDALIALSVLSILLLRRPDALAAAVAAIPAGALFSVVGKRLFESPRPGAVLNLADFHVIGPVLTSHSFPSGHAITAFAFAAAILATLAPTLRTRDACLQIVVGAALAALVGVSRIAVGAHWPVDVVAGAASGWLAGLSGAFAARHWPSFWQGEHRQAGLACLLAALGVWLLWRRSDYPLGEAAQWLAAGCGWVTLGGVISRRRRLSGGLFGPGAAPSAGGIPAPSFAISPVQPPARR